MAWMKRSSRRMSCFTGSWTDPSGLKSAHTSSTVGIAMTAHSIRLLVVAAIRPGLGCRYLQHGTTDGRDGQRLDIRSAATEHPRHIFCRLQERHYAFSHRPPVAALGTTEPLFRNRRDRDVRVRDQVARSLLRDRQD